MIDDVRKAIEAVLGKAMPGVAFLSVGGTFNLADLKRRTMPIPAVVVACLGISDFEPQGGDVVGKAKFTAYALAQTTTEGQSDVVTRDVGVMELVEAIMRVVPYQTWNGTAFQTPKEMIATNYYSIAAERYNIAIWGVSWSQLVRIQPILPTDIVPLLRVDVKIGTVDPKVETLVTVSGP